MWLARAGARLTSAAPHVPPGAGSAGVGVAPSALPTLLLLLLLQLLLHRPLWHLWASGPFAGGVPFKTQCHRSKQCHVSLIHTSLIPKLGDG